MTTQERTEKLTQCWNILEEVANEYSQTDEMRYFLYEAQDYIGKAEAKMRDRCKHKDVRHKVCMDCAKIYHD